MNRVRAFLHQKRTFLFVLAVIVFFFVNYGYVFRGLYLTLFLGNVPASGWYALRVENACEEELSVTLYALTYDSYRSPWDRIQMEIAGWHSQVGVTLASGEEGILQLPFRGDDRSAVFLLFWKNEHDYLRDREKYMGFAIMKPANIAIEKPPDDNYLRASRRGFDFEKLPVFTISNLVGVHEVGFSTLDLAPLLKELTHENKIGGGSTIESLGP